VRRAYIDWARGIAVLVVASTALYVRDGFVQVGAASAGNG
jgi:hypothetical protein